MAVDSVDSLPRGNVTYVIMNAVPHQRLGCQREHRRPQVPLRRLLVAGLQHPGGVPDVVVDG